MKEERKREALTLQELTEVENDCIKVAQKELKRDDNYIWTVGGLQWCTLICLFGVLRFATRCERADNFA